MKDCVEITAATFGRPVASAVDLTGVSKDRDPDDIGVVVDTVGLLTSCLFPDSSGVDIVLRAGTADMGGVDGLGAGAVPVEHLDVDISTSRGVDDDVLEFTDTVVVEADWTC